MCLCCMQEVIIRPGMHRGQRCQYYKVMDPSTPVCLASCGHFYEEDEYELYLLEHGTAPIRELQANSWHAYAMPCMPNVFHSFAVNLFPPAFPLHVIYPVTHSNINAKDIIASAHLSHALLLWTTAWCRSHSLTSWTDFSLGQEVYKTSRHCATICCASVLLLLCLLSAAEVIPRLRDEALDMQASPYCSVDSLNMYRVSYLATAFHCQPKGRTPLL